MTDLNVLLAIKAEQASQREQIKSLCAAFARVEATIEKMASAQGLLHRRMDAICADVASTKYAVERMAPLVDEHERWHQQRVGAGRLLASQKTAAVGIATGGTWLMAKLSPLGAWLPDWLARILFIRS